MRRKPRHPGPETGDGGGARQCQRPPIHWNSRRQITVAQGVFACQRHASTGRRPPGTAHAPSTAVQRLPRLLHALQGHRGGRFQRLREQRHPEFLEQPPELVERRVLTPCGAVPVAPLAPPPRPRLDLGAVTGLALGSLPRLGPPPVDRLEVAREVLQLRPRRRGEEPRPDELVPLRAKFGGKPGAARRRLVARWEGPSSAFTVGLRSDSDIWSSSTLRRRRLRSRSRRHALGRRWPSSRKAPSTWALTR